MIPEDIRSRIIDWCINETYNEWELWALRISTLAYKTALEQARAQSNARIKEVNEFTRLRASKKDPKDPLVYTPKDMR